MPIFIIPLFLFLAVSSIFGSELRDDAFMQRIIETVCSNVPEAEVATIKGKGKLQERYKAAQKIYLNWADEQIGKIVTGNPKLKNELDVLPLTLTSIERLWSEEHAQRKSGPLSLSELVNAADQLAELKARIENPDDYLVDIDNYKRLLLVPTYSGQIYNWIERIFFRNQRKKAAACFNFFLLDENQDEFTRGAALFFIGRAAYSSPIENNGPKEAYTFALPKFLEAQRYATCLTYISYAYIWAAKIYSYFGYNKQALALVMIDVPSVDLSTMKQLRHRDGYKYALRLDDKTNSVKHLQEWVCYDPTFKPPTLQNYDEEDLWYYCVTNRFNDYDKFLAISQALEDEDPDIPERELLTEALLHPWPKISELPENIATNRILNNNVFKN